MNEFDLDRLARVWQEEPPKAEIAWLEKNALLARRRARSGQWLEAAFAIAVAAIVVVLVLIRPAAETVAAGGGALILLLMSQRRQRRLRAHELESLSGSTEDMLDQSIARARAAEKRGWLGLISIGPATALGLLLAHTVLGHPGSRLISEDIARGRTALIASILVVSMVLHLILAIRRNRAEFVRLVTLRDAYRGEENRTS